MNRRYLSALAVLPLVLSLLAVPVAHAQVTISGNWVMTQAAAQSQGAAPSAIACGKFFLDVTPQGDRGSFKGSLSFTVVGSIAGGLAGLMIPGVDGVQAEQISGTLLTLPSGAQFVSFSGSVPVLLFGSFASPSSQRSPSIDPTKLGCPKIERGGLLGLVHLPGQGTEGLTLFG